MEFSALPKADRCPEEGQLKRGPVIELPSNEAIPAGVVASLLDLLDQPVLIADRAGRILQANVRSRQRLANHGFSVDSGLNLFSDLLRITPNVIANRIESGEQRINSKFECCGGAARARVQWLAEMDWLVGRIEDAEKGGGQAQSAATQKTGQ